MSVVQIINLNALSIYLMDLTEFQGNDELKYLTHKELERLKSIHHSSKKNEFIATRFLKHNCCGPAEIAYDATGGPYIEDVGHISISHSSTFVAFALNPKFRIGIDIEPIAEKAVRVQRRFCTTEEAKIFDPTNDFDMSLLWSFKETLYKLSDLNHLLFLYDILVSQTANGYIGHIKTSKGMLNCVLEYQRINDTILTYNTTEIGL